MIENALIKQAFESALIDLAEKLQNDSPVGATGDFKRSWDVETAEDPETLKGVISNLDPIGRWKAIGRGPGKFPPFGEGSALKAWTIAKGMDRSAAFLIARKIAHSGTDRWQTEDNVMGATRDNEIPLEKMQEYRDYLIERINFYLE